MTLLPTGLLLAQTEPGLPVPASPVLVGVMAAYLLVVTLIGVWATRATRSADDFFLAGRSIGPVALALSAVAATLSGFTFIGGPGLMWAVGLGALFIILPAGITNAIGAWTLARRMRLLSELRGVLTLPEAIGARYRSPELHALAAVSVLVAIVGYMATNILAMGIVLEAVLGTGLVAGIWIGAGVTVLYAAGGGIRAGIWTDVFQGIVMAVASVLVFGYALAAGSDASGGVAEGLAGLSRAILDADPGFLEPWGHLAPTAALSFLFVFSMGVLGQPHVLHKFYMLRDPRAFRWYPLLSAVALCLTVLLFFGVGMAVKALVEGGAMAAPVSADGTTPRFLLERTPLLLAAVVFAGAVAAIMSTLNSFMNVGAAALVHDLPEAVGALRRRRRGTGAGNGGARAADGPAIGAREAYAREPDARASDTGAGPPEPRRHPALLPRGRVGTVVLTVLAATVAQVSGTLVAFLGIFGWGLFASTLVPALAIGLNWSGATRLGAGLSIGTGLVGTLALETAAWFGWIDLPAGIQVAGLMLLLSFAAFFAGSWWTRGRAASELDPDLRVLVEG
ncbi:MAG: hypothetical protein EA352_02560 [Gemmatimonadales bacterium]|nr:MAG: hypothetical protein EA352_02560 [Gemmatimonadales bacterium]